MVGIDWLQRILVPVTLHLAKVSAGSKNTPHEWISANSACRSTVLSTAVVYTSTRESSALTEVGLGAKCQVRAKITLPGAATPALGCSVWTAIFRENKRDFTD